MSDHDEHHELEALLDGLPAREPSQMLDERVADALRSAAGEVSASRVGMASRWRALATAAAVLLVGAVTLAVLLNDISVPPENTAVVQQPDVLDPDVDPLPLQQPEAEVAEAGYRFAPEPIDLEWSRDLGEQLRTAPNGKPYRAVVREVVDQRTWYDPDTGATMQVSTPRYELVIRHQPAF